MNEKSTLLLLGGVESGGGFDRPVRIEKVVNCHVLEEFSK